MATNIKRSDGLDWKCCPVTFHNNKGKNISLQEDNRVATRVKSRGHAIVFTAKPVRFGQLFKIIMTREDSKLNWAGKLCVGFTGEDPANSTLTEHIVLGWRKQDKYMLYISYNTLYYNDKELCKLGFDPTDNLVDQSLSLLLTSEGECQWFLGSKQIKSVPVRDVPLDQPMWGVVDVNEPFKQVRAEICTLSNYPLDLERRLIEMGLIDVYTMHETCMTLRQQLTRVNKQLAQSKSSPTLFQKLFGFPSDSAPQQQLTQARKQLEQSQSNCQQLRQELTQTHEHTAVEIQQLTQQLTQSNQQLLDSKAKIKLLTQQLHSLQVKLDCGESSTP